MKKVIFLLLLLLPISLAQNYTVEQLPNKYVFPKYGCISPRIKIISSFPLIGWKTQVISPIWGAALVAHKYNTSYVYSREVDLIYEGKEDSNYIYTAPSIDVGCGDVRISLLDEHGRRVANYYLYPTIKDFPYTVEVKIPTSEQLNISGMCYPDKNKLCLKNMIEYVYLKYTPDLDNGYIRIEGWIAGYYDPSYSWNDVKLVLDVKINDENQQYAGTSKYSEPGLDINEYCNVHTSYIPEGWFESKINCTYPTDTGFFRIAKVCFSYYYRYYWLFWKPVNSICVYTSGFMSYPNREYTYISVYPDIVDVGNPFSWTRIQGEVGLWGLGGFPEFAVVEFRNNETNETKYIKLPRVGDGPMYFITLNRDDILDFIGTGTWKVTMYFYNNFCPDYPYYDIWNEEDACFEKIDTGGISARLVSTTLKAYYKKPSILTSYGEYNSSHLVFRAFFTYLNSTIINGASCLLEYEIKYADGTREPKELYTGFVQTPDGYYELSIPRNFTKSGTCKYTITCEKVEGEIIYSNSTSGEFPFYPRKVLRESPEFVLGTPYDIIFTPSILYTIISGILGAAASRFDPNIGGLVFVILLAILTIYGKISVLVSLPVGVITLAALFVFKRFLKP